MRKWVPTAIVLSLLHRCAVGALTRVCEQLEEMSATLEGIVKEEEAKVADPSEVVLLRWFRYTPDGYVWGEPLGND